MDDVMTSKGFLTDLSALEVEEFVIADDVKDAVDEYFLRFLGELDLLNALCACFEVAFDSSAFGIEGIDEDGSVFVKAGNLPIA